MDIKKALEILEALASGFSPVTGEVIDNDSVLNDRTVIRALQIAIDYLKKDNSDTLTSVEIDEVDIKEAINLFKEQGRNPTPNNLTGFFLSTRHFKTKSLITSKLYGKFKGAYTSGQLIDFFSGFLLENQISAKGNSKEDVFKQIDFFDKPKFNLLTDNGIKQLKGKINEIGVLKTDNLSQYVIDARKSCPRAYEQWSEKEIELLSKAIRYTNDLDLLSDCFQRGRGSIESAAKKIILSTQKGAE